MHHVLIGLGYVAQFLIQELNKQHIFPITVGRSLHKYINLSFHHIQQDIQKPGLELPNNYCLYYFVPPNKENIEDTTLQYFLKQIENNPPQKIIYIGSSGIYGDHQGQWVDETSTCYIQTPRQKQRQSAEQQLLRFSQRYHIPCALLRVAGIYGPDRLPIDLKAPIIYEHEAPWINHIYVRDLAKILALLGQQTTYHGILNIADGEPQSMGFLQAQWAKLQELNEPQKISFEEALSTASDFKKEFMLQNKRLHNHRLMQVIQPYHLKLTSIKDALNQCKNS